MAKIKPTLKQSLKEMEIPRRKIKKNVKFKEVKRPKYKKLFYDKEVIYL